MHFFRCQKFSLPVIILNQQVDSQKAATKQVNQMQNRLTEKSVHSERSTEPSATGRRVQKEEKRIGLLNKETAKVRGVFDSFSLLHTFAMIS